MELQLPQIRDFLPRTFGETEPWIFIKPMLGQQLLPLHEEDSQHSPKTATMALRLMTLLPNNVIPFHVHERKEKVYIAQDDTGCMQVIIVIDGAPRWFEVERRMQRLVVPPRCPHAIIYRSIRRSGYLVIASTNDGSDICWEKDADELILNKHRPPV